MRNWEIVFLCRGLIKLAYVILIIHPLAFLSLGSLRSWNKNQEKFNWLLSITFVLRITIWNRSGQMTIRVLWNYLFWSHENLENGPWPGKPYCQVFYIEIFTKKYSIVDFSPTILGPVSVFSLKLKDFTKEILSSNSNHFLLKPFFLLSWAIEDKGRLDKAKIRIYWGPWYFLIR